MRKPVANKIKKLLQRELGKKFTLAGYRRAKKIYYQIPWYRRHLVG